MRLLMKKHIFSLLVFLAGLPLFVLGKGVDEAINEFFKPISDVITAIVFVSFAIPIGGDQVIQLPIFLLLLIGGALGFTLYFRFPNLRYFRLAIDTVRGKYHEQGSTGEVSHFQALTAALSGTVGLGNIAGVAVAISIGGPGATFWMIFAGLIGMSSKFVECTLGVKYREVDDAGIVYGGPMYYLQKGFASMSMLIGGRPFHFSGLGKTLAIIFSVATIGGAIGGGNMFQANQSYKQLNDMTATAITAETASGLVGTTVYTKGGAAHTLVSYTAGQASMTRSSDGQAITVAGAEFHGAFYERPLASYGWAVGLIFAALVAVVIIGGIKSIARVTDKLVPIMCGIYLLSGLVVIAYNYEAIPSAFGAIFAGAFTGYKAMAGGMIGVMLIGLKRAAFSNEAGIGSASIAHSAVKTNYPASEGVVALLEPFIDTVVVCTMTALVIVISGAYKTEGADGVTLTSNAFATVMPWFPYLLTVAIILFAFSTMISWSYYGMQAWAYLFGRGKAVDYAFKFIFCAMVVVGASSEMQSVIDFSDAMIFSMLFPNIIGLVFLAPVVKHELALYLDAIKSGVFAKVK
jgi:alanine or glycine:cation symporter, AGCS family